MFLVQYGYNFLVLIFLFLLSSPKGSENNETKNQNTENISHMVYTEYHAITITYNF